MEVNMRYTLMEKMGEYLHDINIFHNKKILKKSHEISCWIKIYQI